jgi:hypothetical protein
MKRSDKKYGEKERERERESLIVDCSHLLLPLLFASLTSNREFNIKIKRRLPPAELFNAEAVDSCTIGGRS